MPKSKKIKNYKVDETTINKFLKLNYRGFKFCALDYDDVVYLKQSAMAKNHLLNKYKKEVRKANKSVVNRNIEIKRLNRELEKLKIQNQELSESITDTKTRNYNIRKFLRKIGIDDELLIEQIEKHGSYVDYDEVWRSVVRKLEEIE